MCEDDFLLLLQAPYQLAFRSQNYLVHGPVLRLLVDLVYQADTAPRHAIARPGGVQISGGGDRLRNGGHDTTTYHHG